MKKSGMLTVQEFRLRFGEGVAVRRAVVAAALAGRFSVSSLRGREPGLYRIASGA